MNRAAVAIIFLILVSCGPTTTSAPTVEQPFRVPSTVQNDASNVPLVANNSALPAGFLKVGSFNIQIFGQSKASNAAVMAVLADVVRQYDVLAIQEIRDSSETSLPALVRQADPTGNYQYVVSPRLGRTSSKEQYAFIYNSTKVSVMPGTAFTYEDTLDTFEREPFFVRFRMTNGFDFWIGDIHTKPDDASNEINSLPKVLSGLSGDDDVVLVGDFNADCNYYNNAQWKEVNLGKYEMSPESWDTTVGSTDCAYDRIVVTPQMSRHVTKWGVVRSAQITSSVSDHYPIYFLLSENLTSGTRITEDTVFSGVATGIVVSSVASNSSDPCPVFASRNSNKYHIGAKCSSIKKENLVCYPSVGAARADGKTALAQSC